VIDTTVTSFSVVRNKKYGLAKLGRVPRKWCVCESVWWYDGWFQIFL